MSNRTTRRADLADFRRGAAHLVTHLIDSSTSLDGHAALKAAVAFWQANRVLRKPSPGIASVSALCCACWRGLPADELEIVATRLLRKLVPGGRFLDGLRQ